MAFAVVLLATAAVVSAIRWREPARLLVSGVMVVDHRRQRSSCCTCPRSTTTGPRHERQAARRSVTESELYGLKLSRLVTPQGGHRFEPLGDIGVEGPGQEPGAERRRAGPRPPRHGGLPRRALRRAGQRAARDRTARGDLRRPDDRPALWETGSLITVLAVLFGTIGGFSILLSMAGFSQVRVWNRICVIIAFFALVIVATWFERLVARGCGASHSVPAHRCSAAWRSASWPSGCGTGIPPQALPVRRDRPRVEPRRGLRRGDRAADARRVRDLPAAGDGRSPRSNRRGRWSTTTRSAASCTTTARCAGATARSRGGPTPTGRCASATGSARSARFRALLGMGFTGLWVDTYGYTDGGRGDRSRSRPRSGSSRSAARTVVSSSTTSARTSAPRTLRRRARADGRAGAEGPPPELTAAPPAASLAADRQARSELDGGGSAGRGPRRSATGRPA